MVPGKSNTLFHNGPPRAHRENFRGTKTIMTMAAPFVFKWSFSLLPSFGLFNFLGFFRFTTEQSPPHTHTNGALVLLEQVRQPQRNQVLQPLSCLANGYKNRCDMCRAGVGLPEDRSSFWFSCPLSSRHSLKIKYILWLF